jgi:hypothetical protein
MQSFPTIYEIFIPFKILLCFCGFWYNGGDANKRNQSVIEIIKFIFSIFYSVLIITFFFLNWIWGEQEPESSKSFLINQGWHKLHLFELFMLPVVIWNNYYHRHEISECMTLIAQ